MFLSSGIGNTFLNLLPGASVTFPHRYPAVTDAHRQWVCTQAVSVSSQGVTLGWQRFPVCALEVFVFPVTGCFWHSGHTLFLDSYTEQVLSQRANSEGTDGATVPLFSLLRDVRRPNPGHMNGPPSELWGRVALTYIFEMKDTLSWVITSCLGLFHNRDKTKSAIARRGVTYKRGNGWSGDFDSHVSR